MGSNPIPFDNNTMIVLDDTYKTVSERYTMLPLTDMMFYNMYCKDMLFIRRSAFKNNDIKQCPKR